MVIDRKKLKNLYYYNKNTKEIIPKEEILKLIKEKKMNPLAKYDNVIRVSFSKVLKDGTILKEPTTNTTLSKENEIDNEEINTLLNNKPADIKSIDEFDKDFAKDKYINKLLNSKNDGIKSIDRFDKDFVKDKEISKLLDSKPADIKSIDEFDKDFVKNKKSSSEDKLNHLLDLFKENEIELNRIKKELGDKYPIKEDKEVVKDTAEYSTVAKKSKLGNKIKAKFKTMPVKITSVVLAVTTITTMGFGVKKLEKIKKENSKENIASTLTITDYSKILQILDNNINYYNGENDKENYYFYNTSIAEDVLSYGRENIKDVFSIVFSDDRYYYNANNKFENLKRTLEAMGYNNEEQFFSSINMTKEQFYNYGKHKRDQIKGFQDKYSNLIYNPEFNEIEYRRK